MHYRFCQERRRLISASQQVGCLISLFSKRSTLPPDILLAGARHNHDVKCFEVGQRDISVPHSAISFRASVDPMPWISVRSTLRKLYNSVRISKFMRLPPLLCFFLVTAFPVVRSAVAIASFSARSLRHTQLTGWHRNQSTPMTVST